MPTQPAIAPALGAIITAVRERDEANRRLYDTLRKAKRPVGPHTADELLVALSAAGVDITRSTLYEWLAR